MRAALLYSLLLASGSVVVTAEPANEPARTNVTANGLVADFYQPTNHAKPLPAIIVLGGSEGGLGAGAARVARAFAEHGYAILQLAEGATVF